MAAADSATTPAGGQLIAADPAAANKVYNNDVLGDGLTYSSPDIHTVPPRTFRNLWGTVPLHMCPALCQCQMAHEVVSTRM